MALSPRQISNANQVSLMPLLDSKTVPERIPLSFATDLTSLISWRKDKDKKPQFLIIRLSPLACVAYISNYDLIPNVSGHLTPNGQSQRTNGVIKCIAC